ncbi:MAG: hypothetical protein J6T81_05695 [Bacteroidales bacterium]|nr:hypothetical protein [Bacteroidales bacterium]
MKRFIVFLLVLLFIAIAMVITCPEEDVHKERVSLKLKELYSETIVSRVETDDGIMGLFREYVIVGLQLLGVFSDSDTYFEINNYYLCNIGKLKINGKSSIVSIGLFNHVYLIDNFDDFKVALNNIE